MSNLIVYLERLSLEKQLYMLQTLARHLVDADQMERLHYMLTDLEFIEAKCEMGMVNDLRADYTLALDTLPEAREEKAREHAHGQQITRYYQEIIAYAAEWNRARELHAADPINYAIPKSEELPLPAILPSMQLWTDHQIWADIERILQNPTRLDYIQAFSNFVTAESHNLLRFALHPGFCLQQAYNYADSGLVSDAAEKIIHSQNNKHLLLQNRKHRTPSNFRPALVRTLETERFVGSVCVAADGNIVVASYEGGWGWDTADDNNPRVWNVATGELLYKLEGHRGLVHCIRLTPDSKTAVSASRDKTLRVWSLETGQCLHTLTGHTDWVQGVSLTPDGKMAVSGSNDKTLRVWNLETGQCFRTLEDHTDKVLSVSVTPDGRTVVSGSQDLTLRVWDLVTGRCRKRLEGHEGPVCAVCVTADGKTAVSAGHWDKTLRVWDIETGRCLHKLSGHAGWVESVDITPDGRTAISASSDHTLRAWDLQTGKCLRTLTGHTNQVLSVSVTPDGRTAVSGGKDQTLRVWNVATGQLTPIFVVKEHKEYVESVRLSPNDVIAVSASRDKTLRLWDIETAQCIRTFEGHSSAVTGVTMMPYDPIVVSASADGTLRMWDANGQCLRELEGYSGGFSSLSSTQDGRTLVSGSDDGRLCVWDLHTGQCKRVINAHRPRIIGTKAVEGVNSIALAPDGKIAVSAGSDTTIRVWNLETGMCIHTLGESEERIQQVTGQVSPDGRTIVSGSASGNLYVWDLVTGKRLKTLKGHAGWIESISLSPDGKLALSGSAQTLRVWDLGTGQCLAIYYASSIVRSLSEVRTEKQIAIGLDHGQIVFVSLYGCNFGIPIVTASRLWSSNWNGTAGHWDEQLTTICEHCGKRSAPAPVVLDAIRSINAHLTPEQSPCLEIPAEAWNESRLLSECPHCHGHLKFNPFVVDALERDAHAVSSLQGTPTEQRDTVGSVNETPDGLTAQLSGANKGQLDLVNRINVYKQELIIHRNLGDHEREIRTLNNLGDAYLELGEILRASEFFEQYLQITREIGNTDEESVALNKLGDAYSELGETHRAIEFYKQALTIAREKGDRRSEGATQDKLGQTYMILGENFLAIKCFGEWIGIAKAIGDRKGEGYAYLDASLAFMFSPFPGQAIKHAETALDIFEEIEEREGMARARYVIARLHTQSVKHGGKKWWQFWK